MSAPLLVRACRRESVERTPVWFMRQAGRSLPEYREIRKQHGLFEVCRRPELCAEVTLQPVRAHGVDAAVMFADIMLPVLGMGVDVELVENVGPVVEAPVRSLADVERLSVPEPEESVPFILEAVRLVREGLTSEQGLVGFAGGPFTVAGYLIEGKPTREFKLTKACMYGQPEVWHALMEKLAAAFALYVNGCVRAGADVIQLFDSWVGALSVDDYREFVAPYSARVLAAVDVPTIHFGTGTAHLLEEMAEAGGDVIGVDWRLPIERAWELVGDERGVQGNLEPALLLGPWERVEAVRAADSRCRRRPAGPHLQPRPRRAPGDRPGRPAPAGRPRPREHVGGSVMDAVVLMAYGSPSAPEDVRPYLEDVRGGRPVSEEAVEALSERYRRIGGRSPLDEVTEAQRAALERELETPVFVGMKHWRPRIAEAVEAALTAGATRIVGLVLAPHYSRLSVGGYRDRLEEAVAGRAELVLVESWHAEPAFIEVLAGRVQGAGAWVVFTAHSLPERILAEGDPYREQLLETARLVAERAGLEGWSFAFQSASETGEPWLGPDLLEELERLRAAGVSEVLVAPVGFVSDHLEILWDIDVEARERAEQLGLELRRIDSLNDDPAFVRALGEVVRKAVSVRSAA